MKESTALRRYLLEDGQLGWLPDWYLTLRAARYLGVPPWVLLDQPLYWLEKARIAENVENEVESERNRRAAQSG